MQSLASQEGHDPEWAADGGEPEARKFVTSECPQDDSPSCGITAAPERITRATYPAIPWPYAGKLGPSFAYLGGQRHARQGGPADANPWPRGSLHSAAWDCGHQSFVLRLVP